jgi:hypothetical protein
MSPVYKRLSALSDSFPHNDTTTVSNMYYLERTEEKYNVGRPRGAVYAVGQVSHVRQARVEGRRSGRPGVLISLAGIGRR